MQHIIRKQQLELFLDGHQPPFHLQNRLNGLFYDALLPMLEDWFNQLTDEEEVLYIDRLVLDLGAFSAREFNEQTLKERLAKKLKTPETIQTTQPTNTPNTAPTKDTHRRTTRQNAFEQWIGYMEKGYLPWNLLRTSKEWENKVLETLAADYNSVTRLRQILTTQPVTLTRIVLQQDETFLTRLVETLTTISQSTLQHTLQELRLLLQQGATIENTQQNNPEKPVPTKSLPRSTSQHTTSKTPTIPPAAITISHPVVPALQTIWQDTLVLAASLGREGTTQQLITQLFDTYWKDPAFTHPTLTTYLNEHAQIKTLLTKKLAKLRVATPEPKIPNTVNLITQSENPAAQKPPIPTNKQTPTNNPQTPTPIPKTIPGPTYTTETETTAPAPQTFSPEDLPAKDLPDEGLFLSNAGVILAHSFLNPLFKRTNLVKEGKFITEESRQKAIHLVHYLASGRTLAEEHELTIARMLCGCPLEIPMQKQLDWPKEDLQEADSLLEGLIAHWGVKGITLEGLRGNFLTRHGKLSPKQEKLHLTIEKNAVDILIRTYPLPWNMHIIKLPWLSQTIYLDW
jgi:hypothetical protein